MPNDQQNQVDVFPINTGAFGFRTNWFDSDTSLMTHPAYLLMTLLLIVSVGVMALKRFEDVDLEKKLWTIPVTLTAIAFWPYVVLGLKDLVGTFNTFLVYDVFHKSWHGFGFLDTASAPNFFAWSAESFARLLPNLAYWVIYAFYLISFFFYAVLGPLILAKGVLADEVEGFFELIQELVLLMLWQTTAVVLIAFILPQMIDGKPLPPQPDSAFYFHCLILGIMIFFVPSLTRKFGGHVGASFAPSGFRYGGAALGLTAVGALGGAALGVAGFPLRSHGFLSGVGHQISKADEFRERYQHRKEAEHLESELDHLGTESHDDSHGDPHEGAHEEGENTEESTSHRGDLVELAQRAKTEIERPETLDT